MTTGRKAELTMVLSQMETLIDRLDELGQEEAADMASLPKRSPERKRAQELCDGIDDAIDSLTDAIHCLEEGMDPES